MFVKRIVDGNLVILTDERTFQTIQVYSLGNVHISKAAIRKWFNNEFEKAPTNYWRVERYIVDPLQDKIELVDSYSDEFRPINLV